MIRIRQIRTPSYHCSFFSLRRRITLEQPANCDSHKSSWKSQRFSTLSNTKPPSQSPQRITQNALSSNPAPLQSSSSSSSSPSPNSRARRTWFQYIRRHKLRVILIIGIGIAGVNSVYYTLTHHYATIEALPLRLLSRLWGKIHQITLPTAMRAPLYHLWSYLYDCNLDECDAPLESYHNLNAFFTRGLKAGCRPIGQSPLVSPVDGVVTSVGSVNADGTLEQIKGSAYRLDEFTGASIPAELTSLHYVVFYLAPGDYHRIHAPADAIFSKRIHVAGDLFPVHPALARYVPFLFTRNERVILLGRWTYGYHSIGCVGALNVGSVKLSFDEQLITNRIIWKNLIPYHRRINTTNQQSSQPPPQQQQQASIEAISLDPKSTSSNVEDTDYVKVYGTGVLADGEVFVSSATRRSAAGLHVSKGEEIARFELGSSVVVIFEVSGDRQWKWNVAVGDKVRYGQSVGDIVT